MKIKNIKEFIETSGKILCGACNENLATWLYMPSTSDKSNPYFCEKCVWRGCSCNYHHSKPEDFLPPLEQGEVPEGIEGKDWKWVEKPATEHETAITKEEGLFVYLDEHGRESPCCEYWYSEDGWEKDK